MTRTIHQKVFLQMRSLRRAYKIHERQHVKLQSHYTAIFRLHAARQIAVHAASQRESVIGERLLSVSSAIAGRCKFEKNGFSINENVDEIQEM